MSNPYDELYKQIDFNETPFGYPMDYYIWRTIKLKSEIAKYVTEDGWILDVGGGTGVMAEFLPEFVDRSKYINLDVSEEILKYCKYKHVLAPAEDIPFPKNSFDYVLQSEVLEHVKDKVKTLEECYRVLKFGGKLILTTPRTGWSKDYLLSPFALFYVIHLFIFSIEFIVCRSKFRIVEGVVDIPSDEEWLRKKLESIGFNVVAQYRLDNHPPWKSTSKFWRRFADRYIDPRKFGLCTFVVCSKGI